MNCPNPNCRSGSDVSRMGRARACPSCDGRGYLEGADENRRRFYWLRGVVTELELDSRGMLIRDEEAAMH
jgi:hypothetical protein